MPTPTMRVPAIRYTAAPHARVGGLHRLGPTQPTAEVGSYDLGLMFGNQLVNSGFGKAASRNELMRGIDEALAGKIPTAEQRKAVQQFSRANREALAASNAKLAKEFLARNALAGGTVLDRSEDHPQ